MRSQGRGKVVDTRKKSGRRGYVDREMGERSRNMRLRKVKRQGEEINRESERKMKTQGGANRKQGKRRRSS